MADEFKSTAPKPFVFVLMPFAEEFNDIYEIGIKEAAEAAGAYAERLDKQIFTENILDRLYNQINKSDILVADMTGRNPNVFYEVGYAHALGKIVLLLTKNADDIPFDLKHYPHIVYGSSISRLRNDLSERLGWAVAESKRLNTETNSEKIALSINDLNIPELSIGSEIPHIIFDMPEKYYILLQNLKGRKIPFYMDGKIDKEGCLILSDMDNVYDLEEENYSLRNKVMPLFKEKGYIFDGRDRVIIISGYYIKASIVIMNVGSNNIESINIYVITESVIVRDQELHELKYIPDSYKFYGDYTNIYIYDVSKSNIFIGAVMNFDLVINSEDLMENKKYIQIRINSNSRQHIFPFSISLNAKADMTI